MPGPPPPRFELLHEILRSRIGTAIRGLLALLVIGTVGFWILGVLHEAGLVAPKLDEHWSLFECFFFTTITLTTVGYGETLTASGSLASFWDVRLYTALLLLLGMIATAYFLSSATAFFVEGDLRRVLEKRRMLKTIAQLAGHYIVCGAGQTGRHIAEEVAASGKQCVVIDSEARNVALLQEHGVKVHSIIGDATKDETLEEAGIGRAAGLCAVLADDKDNLFLTISARQLNPKLRIVSKAIDPHTRAKLVKAGADGVVSPNFIGGMRMASELVRPAVVNFLDQMLRGKDATVRFAEVRVGAPAAGKTLRELDVPRRIGLLIVALRQPGADSFHYNPGPDATVRDGTILVVMGEIDRVTKLEELVSSETAAQVVGLTTQVLSKDASLERAAESLKDPRDNL